MLVNQGTAVSTSGILLVPYEKVHVITYHEWMKDEEIQLATASEPLTLAEEYDMQRSWRSDHDKLTFIACLPIDGAHDGALAGSQDAPDRMLGDVNLFLSAADDSPDSCVGELELMIARPSLRRRGYGRAAIVAFLNYIAQNIQAILDEYRNSQSAEKMSLADLRVKIGSKNEKSIRLFESIGFIQTKDGPNYFDEIELSLGGAIDAAKSAALMQNYGIQAYREIPYTESSA